MNDFDLESKLKDVPLPERPEDYWENFPAQVRLNLHRAAMRPAPNSFWLPRLAWAGGFALVLILGIWCAQFKPLKIAAVALSKNEKHFRNQFAQFETKLHVFMQDEHGMHHLIAEKE
ncbi:MAG: hypothetical protein WDM80_08825 [Limisphaerales bacterium]